MPWKGKLNSSNDVDGLDPLERLSVAKVQLVTLQKTYIVYLKSHDASFLMIYHASQRQILELFKQIIDLVAYKGNCLRLHQAGVPLKDDGFYLRDGCRDNSLW